MESAKSTAKTEVTTEDDSLTSYLYEISVMAKYASQQGKTLSADGFSAKIDKCLQAKEKYDATHESPFPSGVTIQDAIDVHSHLSKIIKPVTFDSLDATKPGFLNINRTIKVIIISTSVSLIFLIIMLFLSENLSGSSYLFKLSKYLKIFLAAWLGAGVYCLWTARHYLIDRTYDPRYNPTYLIRLILGIALGTILGLFGDQLLKQDSEIVRLSQTVMAIIGGFASDAVASLLARVADTLKAFVVGTDKDQIDAETAKAKNREKNSAATLLLDVKSKIAGCKLPEDELKSLMTKIDEYLND